MVEELVAEKCTVVGDAWRRDSGCRVIIVRDELWPVAGIGRGGRAAAMGWREGLALVAQVEMRWWLWCVRGGGHVRGGEEE